MENTTYTIETMLNSVEPQLRGKYPAASEAFIKREAQRHRNIIFSMIIMLFCKYMKTHEIHPAITSPVQKTKHQFYFSKAS